MARKKVKAAPRRRGGKLMGPSWDDWEKLTPDAFGRLQRIAVDFYYQEYKPADLIPYFFEWMKNNGYTKDQIANAKKGSPRPNFGTYAKILQDGCPDINPAYKEYWESLPGTGGEMKPHSYYLRMWADECVERGEKVVEEVEQEEEPAKKKYVPTIQERIRDQAYDMLEDVDEWLDKWTEDAESFDPKGFDIKRHFAKLQPSQAHARKMKTLYETALDDFNDLERMPTAGQLKKMDELEADLWAQLKEGYSHIKKADVKKYRTAINTLMTELDFIIEKAKATRKPRKPKVRSASKQVEKLKFCKADPKYSLASIDPSSLIGANELWVFNVKTRKLGKYLASNIDPKGMAREGTGFSVKGTTILGFDENLSVQKTLRKPEEQLKEFKAAGKVALRKFLDEINTTDTKLNGRINPDTVLLKVS